MFHTMHSTRVSGPRDFDRESDRIVEELARRGFFIGLGSTRALQVLAECSPAAEQTRRLLATDD